MTMTRCDWFNASYFEVVEAREYLEIKNNAKKVPFILLKNKLNKRMYSISNRMVLFGLLKRLQPELTYKEFMQTVYDAMGSRPPLGDIIQGYLWSREGEPEDVIDIHYKVVEDGNWDVITHIDSNDSQSLYYRNTYDFISANFLPHYYQGGEPKIKIDGLQVPYMRFISECGKITINILSHRNKTSITGTITVQGRSMQPLLIESIKGWTHLVDASWLGRKLSMFDEKLNEELTRVQDMNTKMLADTTRVRSFKDKNKLERENWHTLTN